MEHRGREGGAVSVKVDYMGKRYTTPRLVYGHGSVDAAHGTSGIDADLSIVTSYTCSLPSPSIGE